MFTRVNGGGCSRSSSSPWSAIIRAFDARFVRKEADGSFSGFDLTDLDEDGAGDLIANERVQPLVQSGRAQYEEQPQ